MAGTIEKLDAACWEATQSTAGTAGERQLVGTMLLPALQFVKEPDVAKRELALAMFCPTADGIPPGFEAGLSRALRIIMRLGLISSKDVTRIGSEHGMRDGCEVLARVVMVCHCNIFGSSEATGGWSCVKKTSSLQLSFTHD